ncbi:MAG: hypothetical protein OXC46_00850 [Thaumarchaeota archaeon]|nr:hypothetical protein [Nitrososphaerota archaeon]
MSSKSAIINDRHIICPHCKNDVTVLRPHGGGAQYAKKWDKLPQRALDVLQIWHENPVYRRYWLTKDTILAICKQEKLFMKFASLNARVSELLACGLIESSKHERTDHQTTKKPLYKIDTKKAKLVLLAKGNLGVLEIIK